MNSSVGYTPTVNKEVCMKKMEECLERTLSEVLPVIQDRIMNATTYFGVKALKNPLDAWVYQELIWEQKPDVIVEIGNAYGGGTLMLAHLCDLIGHGRIIGVDLSHIHIPAHVSAHPRVTMIEGDACLSFDRVRSMIEPGANVLVIEDSSHTYENTLNVLRRYAGLIRPGGYLIVEDGVCHHGLDIGPDPGPFEAIEAFVQECPDFETDRSRESFLVTWNPKGFLRRKTA